MIYPRFFFPKVEPRWKPQKKAYSRWKGDFLGENSVGEHHSAGFASKVPKIQRGTPYGKSLYVPYIVGILWVIISQESLEKKTINITGTLLGIIHPSVSWIHPSVSWKMWKNQFGSSYSPNKISSPALTLVQQWIPRRFQNRGPWIQNELIMYPLLLGKPQCKDQVSFSCFHLQNQPKSSAHF